jgi:hypothetical protein
MPTYAVVELSEVGSSAVTATVCSQLCTEDVYHTLATGIWRTCAGLGFGVYRAHLTVPLKAIITSVIAVALTGDCMTGHLFGGPAHIVTPALGLLCADWMQ